MQQVSGEEDQNEEQANVDKTHVDNDDNGICGVTGGGKAGYVRCEERLKGVEQRLEAVLDKVLCCVIL
jgi:hypothetical protein